MRPMGGGQSSSRGVTSPSGVDIRLELNEDTFYLRRISMSSSPLTGASPDLRDAKDEHHVYIIDINLAYVSKICLPLHASTAVQARTRQTMLESYARLRNIKRDLQDNY